jgi:hypothetical protein
LIIVKIKGGLGNQLFQYALGRRLTLERGIPLKLDLSWFGRQSLRKYRLDRFKIKTEIANADDLRYFDYKKRKDLYARIFRKYQSLLPYYQRRNVEQIGIEFDPAILKVPDKVLLKGYWQSEQYFKPIEEIIRRDIQLKLPLTPGYQALAKQVQSTESISIHVRRGDYVQNPRTNSVHGTCSIEYYQRAVDMIQSQVTTPFFYIFSDDPEWVQNNIQLQSPSILVQEDGENSDVQQLHLMSLCNHHIIANSSFSWWGAWLDDSPDKIVIAPARWYSSKKNNKDLLPDNWKTL